MTPGLVLPVVAPLAAAIACLAAYRAPRVQRLIGLASCLCTAVYLAGWLWPRLWSGEVAVLQVGNWPAPYGITLATDAFSGIMLSLSALVGLVVLSYGIAWFAGEREEVFFHPLYHTLLMGVNGAFLTGDIFNLYVFFEVLLVSSFGLLALGARRAQVEGAVKYVAISQVSSALFLLGAGLLYGIAGTLNMADLARKLSAEVAAPYVTVIAILFLVAFGIKAAVFPLFFWLPASYPAARTPISALFGGLLAEVGVYALYRTFTLLFPAQWLAQRRLFLAIAALTMVAGVLGAIAQSDLKRLLAFDIVSQVGYLIMGLGLGSALAMASALYFMIHIVLVKTSLFLAGGLMERATGTTDMRAMGGLLRRRPALAGLFLLPALALAGLPPLSGFFAKLGLVLAGLGERAYPSVAIALGTSLLTLYVMVTAWTRAFLREPYSAPRVAGRPPRALTWVTLGLVAVAVLAGALAGPLFEVTQRAAQQLADTATYQAAVLGR